MTSSSAMFNQDEISLAVNEFSIYNKVNILPATSKEDVLDLREWDERFYVKHTLDLVVGRAANGTLKSKYRLGGNLIIGKFYK